MQARHDTKLMRQNGRETLDIPDRRFDDIDSVHFVEPFQLAQHARRVSPDVERYFYVLWWKPFVAIFDQPMHPYAVFEIDSVCDAAGRRACQDMYVVAVRGKPLRQVVRQAPDAAHNARWILLAQKRNRELL